MSKKISRILLAIVAISLLIISTGCFKRDIIISSSSDTLTLKKIGTETYILDDKLSLKGTSFLSPVIINSVTMRFLGEDGVEKFACPHKFTTQIAVGSKQAAVIDLADIAIEMSDEEAQIVKEAKTVMLRFSFSGILPVDKIYKLNVSY